MYFEKTENKKTLYGIELTQIRYMKDLPQFNVNAGQLGGWISEKAILEQNGKWFLGTEVNALAGTFFGGNFKAGNFKGGIFEGGNFPSNFQNVPFLNGGKYPLNFSGYTENGERLFACGCQVFPESKWTPKFRKELAQKHNFTDSELKISNKMFSLLKELTPKKEM